MSWTTGAGPSRVRGEIALAQDLCVSVETKLCAALARRVGIDVPASDDAIGPNVLA
jgi:hypothetical protein